LISFMDPLQPLVSNPAPPAAVGAHTAKAPLASAVSSAGVAGPPGLTTPVPAARAAGPGLTGAPAGSALASTAPKSEASSREGHFDPDEQCACGGVAALRFDDSPGANGALGECNMAVLQRARPLTHFVARSEAQRTRWRPVLRERVHVLLRAGSSVVSQRWVPRCPFPACRTQVQLSAAADCDTAAARRRHALLIAHSFGASRSVCVRRARPRARRRNAARAARHAGSCWRRARARVLERLRVRSCAVRQHRQPAANWAGAVWTRLPHCAAARAAQGASRRPAGAGRRQRSSACAGPNGWPARVGGQRARW
jgi:hypothetical protein